MTTAVRSVRRAREAILKLENASGSLGDVSIKMADVGYSNSRHTSDIGAYPDTEDVMDVVGNNRDYRLTPLATDDMLEFFYAWEADNTNPTRNCEVFPQGTASGKIKLSSKVILSDFNWDNQKMDNQRLSATIHVNSWTKGTAP